MKVICKRKTIAGLFAVSAAIAAWGAQAATPPIALPLTFTGDIKDNTCGTPTVSGSGTVAFGNIAQSAFGSTAGTVGDTKAFTLTFENCGTDTTGVDVWFVGTTTNAVHAVDNSGDATGVGVQVWDGTTLLESDNVASTSSLSLTSNSAPQVKTLVAKVVQTGTTTPGKGALNATGTLYIQYQ